MGLLQECKESMYAQHLEQFLVHGKDSIHKICSY